MEYDLAKQLKDAGFPQKTGEYASNASNCNCKTRGLVTSCHVAYIPTLSELIEACGFRLEQLSQRKHTKEGNYWIAEAYSCEECGWKDSYFERGETPEEAVAKLYLAIHSQELKDSKDMID
jgi:hypothetical protein